MMKVEAKLEMSAGGMAASLRLGPFGFNPENFEDFYGSGHVDFYWLVVEKTLSRIAHVKATTINPVRKSILLPGRGNMDHNDRRAIGIALAQYADYAFFGHVREISGVLTANYHPLAKYR